MAGGVTIVVHGQREFGAALHRLNAKSDIAAQAIVTEGGALIAASAKRHFNGGSEPMTRTGTLARSIRMVDVHPTGPGAFMSKTGPTVVYGRRIELGFHGTDSIGRHYNQSGRPFMRPGIKDAESGIAELAQRHWAEALR